MDISSTKTSEEQTALAPWQHLILHHNPFEHLAFFGGVGAGKTFTGSEFAISEIKKDPTRIGLIGANSYDQLSTATLQAFFRRLEFHGYDYVVDRQPPRSWKVKRLLKSYNNTILVQSPEGAVTLILTRVMSDPDVALRGYEISWYWLDETRDTTEYAHNVLLGRMRQSRYRRGLITSTTNGEDWSCLRFARARRGQHLYGSIHVTTREAVQYGILDQGYYNLLLQTYSPLLAQQELDAKHVNVFGGRAYYATGDHNRRGTAPWGDAVPALDRPLVVGCDFNFSPAPCVWVVGQIGPPPYEDCIHWFGEIAEPEVSTVQMTNYLLMRYPGFFYRIFGDASGTRGTTSNAGQTDYNQIGQTLAEAQVGYSIDTDPANPLVKDRVENVNARARNSLGQVRMTYDPDKCPLLDGDFKAVGWKKLTGAMLGKTGRLDDGGDPQRTHAADAVGYPVYKLFPPGLTFEIIPTVPSPYAGGESPGNQKLDPSKS